ncbi:type II toxin-antitoxin system RelE/ParE family toxin [Peristeroidobacter soli]|uniref:type II toxin-antitoxin system RelE/ParE family toxin n=1 Tax=Peristeroidobacter soli TaxID=2497877 RepID=UPI00101E15B7
MKRARFVASARREFLAEVAYYHTREPDLGARFTKAVEAATARALAFPFSGSPASKNTRRVFVRSFPFAVIYRPAPDGILIVAVAHHSRRPAYWHFRVQEERPVYQVTRNVSAETSTWL